MNEENNQFEEEVEAKLDDEWQAPPIPEQIPAEKVEEAEMSEVSTLANIFFEPSRVFNDLRKKPRFILAGLIIIILSSVSFVLFHEKVGFREVTKAKMEASSQFEQMPADKQKEIIDQQSSDVFKYITYGSLLIIIPIVLLLGGLIYWLGANAFGGTASFSKGLAVWIYSTLPPAILATIANVLLLFLKPIEDISPTQAQTGLVQANLGFFVDGKESPVLSAILTSFDLFAIFGYVLAVIGLKVVMKISAGSAAAIVLLLALFGITVKVIFALLFG